MKLELKHIVPYLPYDLKALSVFHGVNLIRCVDVWAAGTLLGADSDKKMMLLPISCLTEEIEHNGERFVPIERINEVMTREWADVCDDWIIALLDDIANADNIIKKCPHDMWEHFVSYHIDVFQLIPAGLAVDKREVTSW